MERFSLLLLCFLAQSAACADNTPVIADSPCKAAYEYHFLNRGAHADDLVGVDLLLKSGADVNGSGYAKYTECVAGSEFSSPLMVAVWRKNIDMVRLLLDAGANANLKEGEGVSPTDIARKHDLPEILALLVRHGGK